MKRVLSILFTVLFLLTALPLGAIPVFAATSGTTGDCTWTLDDNGHLTISGNGAMGDYSWSCGPWNNLITSATIEDGVTTIGVYAFYNCKYLTWVTIPDSVITIGTSAFEDCTILTSATIPDSVTTIGDSAFASCSALTAVNIPSSITAIGTYTFSDCRALTSVTIPDGVTTIGNRAFDYCLSLVSVTIPDSVTTIGTSAFESCRSLAAVTIPNSVTTISIYAFAYCTSLTSVTIPNRVTTIFGSTFAHCTSLTSVTIPYSVTTIGGSAFFNCPALTDVYYTGTAEDKNQITFKNSNDALRAATWHYTACDHIYDHAYDATCNDCGKKREVAIPTTFGGNSVSEDVSGLAFRFGVACEGMEQKRTTAIYDNATVDGYKLLTMGAVVTNGAATIDIPAVYLYDLQDTAATYAVRIVSIPTDQYDRAITATPYIVLEIDGVAITIYGEAQTCSYNDVKN